MTVLESDRAIVKAMTFRDPELHVGSEQQIERMAEYIAAYREQCVDLERQRNLVEIKRLNTVIANVRMFCNSLGGDPKHGTPYVDAIDTSTAHYVEGQIKSCLSATLEGFV